jgi:hypothetical protein
MKNWKLENHNIIKIRKFKNNLKNKEWCATSAHVKHKNLNILNIMKNWKLENHNIIKIIEFNYNWNLTVITLIL